jgi:hypothetical protein
LYSKSTLSKGGVIMRNKLGIGLLCTAIVASMAAAQSAKQPSYDVKKEVTVAGKVVDVKTVPDWMGKDGLNIAVERSDATKVAHVDVATAGFVKMLDFSVAVGDDVTLVGYWGDTADGTPVFLVHEITNKKVTLNVRDPRGNPLW